MDARRTVGRDTVDGAADHQLNLSRGALEDLLGADAVRATAASAGYKALIEALCVCKQRADSVCTQRALFRAVVHPSS